MRQLFFAMALWLAGMSLCGAQDLTWTSPLGTMTIFRSGELEPFMGTTVSLGGETAVDSLTFLDATSLPAISHAEVESGGATFAGIVQLSVTEAQVSGLPFISGGIDFASTGGAPGNGTGGVTLYFLIHVPTPVLIDLSDVRSSFTGAPGADFSMGLFQCDAVGDKFGDALLSFTGSNFDASQSYQTSSPYYLVEMNASANATAGVSNSIEFSYLLGLSSVVAIPEPNSTALLLASAVAGFAILTATRRRRLNTKTCPRAAGFSPRLHSRPTACAGPRRSETRPCP